jgi:hypothetical protein
MKNIKNISLTQVHRMKELKTKTIKKSIQSTKPEELFKK